MGQCVMNKNEKLYLEWLEKQKAEGVKSVTYSTTDGDTSSEEFYAEANAMNSVEAFEVTNYTENFPRYEVMSLLSDMAMDRAIAVGRAQEFVFNDKTTKK